MPNQKISDLPPAVLPLDGTELREIVQDGVNRKYVGTGIVPTYVSITPNPAGTFTDFALPGTGDYTYDVDTTNGDVEIDGVVSQRQDQKVYFSNIGPNRLKLGVGTGATNNRIRANSGPIIILENDGIQISYCSTIGKWLVK